MIRYILVFLLVAHGVAHLVGFVVPWRLIMSAEMPYRTTILQGRVDLADVGIRAYGLVWLALAFGCAVIAIGVLLRSSWWLAALEGLVAVSLVFCVLDWPLTRMGVVANLLILVMAFAAVRFNGGAMALRNPDLERIWAGVPRQAGSLTLNGRPLVTHAIAPGTAPASAVLLKMHGEIKLGRWFPFTAQEVILDDGTFIWAATVSMFGMPVLGSDRLVNGAGSMSWKMFDLFPVAAAAGPEITRSAIGRSVAEMVAWLPSVLSGPSVKWTESGVTIARYGESTLVAMNLDERGGLKTVHLPRWGNPDGAAYGYTEFGVIVDQERTFGAYTIPSKLRAGWFFGTERFEREGEFFRATIGSVEIK